MDTGYSKWRKLDNAALAFPLVTGKDDTRVFRFYCQLKEKVDGEILQSALDQRQAVLDFNLAGKVTIIGYYSSDDILTAVEKGVISVTCDVDTEQLGRYSIEALTEYQKDGRTNSYYNVDINFLDREAVRAMRREVQPK